MKKKLLGVIAAALLLLPCGVARATDYRQMSTAQLAMMRGTIQNATEEEQRAFQEEWQRRVRMMTSAERRQYLGPNEENPAGTASGPEEKGQRPEEMPPAWTPGGKMKNGRLSGAGSGRDRLLVPPVSISPRGFGQEEFGQVPEKKTHRPFAPAPDFNGAPSPFDIGGDSGRNPVGRGGR
ncbi:MAG: hypothetical protein M0017_08690 [Desulfobacteraceae bacterium]|nr:hypothetical protein [Desulfobacteraceae bacterium]